MRFTAPAGATQTLRLATTTSTDNSGLLGALLPAFQRDSDIEVQVIAVGTGKALRLGEHGDVDVVLVHARAAEDRFVAAGFGVDRRDVMFNDFVVVGPRADPDRLGTAASTGDAFKRLALGRQPFVSRGDDSGTHKKERALWQAIGVKPAGAWYREAGQGMGKVLQMASELRAYTLTDRGTWLALRDKLDLAIVFEGGQALRNPYGIIAVNPARHPEVNHAAARKLIDWITSPRGQQLIGAYRRHGEQLFHPNPGAS